MQNPIVVESKLTLEDVLALRAYTDAYYLKMNPYLWRIYEDNCPAELHTKEHTWAASILAVCAAFWKMSQA